MNKKELQEAFRKIDEAYDTLVKLKEEGKMNVDKDFLNHLWSIRIVAQTLVESAERRGL